MIESGDVGCRNCKRGLVCVKGDFGCRSLVSEYSGVIVHDGGCLTRTKWQPYSSTNRRLLGDSQYLPGIYGIDVRLRTRE